MSMGQLESILNQDIVNYLGIVLPLLFLLTGMTITVLADDYIGRRHKVILFHMRSGMAYEAWRRGK